MSKDISINTNENGHILICLYGKKFVSTEPVSMVEGKFKASDIEKLVFVGQKSHDTIVFYPEKKDVYNGFNEPCKHYHTPRQEN